MTTARIMAAALASIAAFLLGNSYAACLLSLPGSPAVNLTEAAKRLPSFLLGHGPLSLEAAALATGLVAACAVWCAWAWSLTHGNPERQGEEHGSARWGTVREGRRFMNLEDPDRNIVLTKHFGMAMDRPDHDRRFERNRNVLVVGGSGSGKTRGFFEPNIMQLNSNYLVTDPKGETLPRMGTCGGAMVGVGAGMGAAAATTGAAGAGSSAFARATLSLSSARLSSIHPPPLGSRRPKVSGSSSWNLCSHR